MAIRLMGGKALGHTAFSYYKDPRRMHTHTCIECGKEYDCSYKHDTPTYGFTCYLCRDKMLKGQKVKGY